MNQTKSFYELSEGKFTIADVFDVALSYLYHKPELEFASDCSMYSCDSIRYAISHLMGYHSNKRYEIPWGSEVDKKVCELHDTICIGLAEMGLDPEGFNAFNDVENPQQARSIWLAWCKMMAEEQNV